MGNKSNTLERATFSTSRLLEFFTEKELTMQMGHQRDWWPVALVKELIDNALDACETANVPPEIEIMVEADAVSIQDNGPGLPIETLKRSLDYTIRVSDKSYYVSPTRGQLGNALKCVYAAPFVVDGERGRVDVMTGGNVHRIDVTLDRVAQRPNLEYTVSPDGVVKNGTLVKIHWVGLAGLLEAGRGAHFYSRSGPPDIYVFLAGYSAFNPHATFRVISSDGSRAADTATKPDWRKWRPNDPTSPHWYDVERLSSLIAAYITDERNGGKARTVREFVSEFKGLSGTAKQKRVMETVGLSGAYLHDLVDDDVDRWLASWLLEAMQNESRPVKGRALGIIGKDHFTAWLVAFSDVSVDSVKYAKRDGVTADGLPFVVEAAFGVMNDDTEYREIVVGLNWAPTLTIPLGRIDHLLSRSHVEGYDPVALLVHIACPRFEFTDRGKSKLALPSEILDALESAIKRVAKGWKAAKEKRRHGERLRRKELERQRKKGERQERASRWTLKDAVFAVLSEAVNKATGDGKYPVSARTLYYQVRPLIQRYAIKGDRGLEYGYLSQDLLTQYRQEYGAIEGLYYDPRGYLYEPHTGKAIPLGTREVDAYTFPSWLYNKILYVEKKGLWPIIQTAKIAERYDMAVIATEGYATEAARVLFERADKDQDYRLFVLHDADPYGYNIGRTLREETDRMPGYKVDVVDLGLCVKEALDLGLESETFIRKKGLPKGLELTELEQEYFTGRRRGRYWHDCKRIELNAMSAPQTVEFIERKLTEAGATDKVVPTDDALARLVEDMYVTQMKKHLDLALDELIFFGRGKGEITDRYRCLFELGDARQWIEDGFKANGAQPWRDAARAEILKRLRQNSDGLETAIREYLRSVLDDVLY